MSILILFLIFCLSFECHPKDKERERERDTDLENGFSVCSNAHMVGRKCSLCLSRANATACRKICLNVVTRYANDNGLCFNSVLSKLSYCVRMLRVRLNDGQTKNNRISKCETHPKCCWFALIFHQINITKCDLLRSSHAENRTNERKISTI